MYQSYEPNRDNMLMYIYNYQNCKRSVIGLGHSIDVNNKSQIELTRKLLNTNYALYSRLSLIHI